MAETGVVGTQLSISAASLEALRPEWVALHASLGDPVPFTHPAWHEVWLRAFGKETGRPASEDASSFSVASPVFLALRDGEKLVGVAALEISGETARQLGNYKICDYAGVLAAPGYEEAVAAGTIEWLVEDLTSNLVLWGVPEDSPMRTAFAAAADVAGWSYEEQPEAVAPRTLLPADFDDYVAGLPKKDRHELRRKLRNLESAGEAAYETVTAPAAIEARFGRFLELMRISREDKDGFLTPPMEAFFRDLARTFAGLGMVRLGTLSLDGQTAAMAFCFESESTAFLYNSGYDPAFAHLAVGLLSKAYAIRDCIGRGKRVFDFLRGDEAYKRHLGGEPRQVLTLRLRQR